MRAPCFFSPPPIPRSIRHLCPTQPANHLSKAGENKLLTSCCSFDPPIPTLNRKAFDFLLNCLMMLKLCLSYIRSYFCHTDCCCYFNYTVDLPFRIFQTQLLRQLGFNEICLIISRIVCYYFCYKCRGIDNNT